MTLRQLLPVLALFLAAPALADTAEGVRKWRAGDHEGAVAAWQAPAAAGDADALFNLGQAYRLGRGVPANRDVAIEYYRRASARGHVAATANLGITLFQAGRKAEALVPMRAAADAGDARAAYVLGVATFTGDGAPKNPVLGLAYVRRAEMLGLDLAGPQVTRMAALMSEDERARAEAAASALAAGRPVSVVLAASPLPAAAAAGPVPPAADSEEEAGEAPAALPATPDRATRAWYVQLGAYTSEAAARTAWAALVAQAASLLEGQAPVYVPRGGLVRLQVGPLGNRNAAAELCARLAAAGRPCFVTGG
ncbi:SPOR domain-containing protein [Thermaurantiacus sp.]